MTGEPAADYPQMAAERGRVEPAPRRVRGYVDGVLVFGTVPEGNLLVNRSAS